MVCSVGLSGLLHNLLIVIIWFNRCAHELQITYCQWSKWKLEMTCTFNFSFKLHNYMCCIYLYNLEYFSISNLYNICVKKKCIGWYQAIYWLTCSLWINHFLIMCISCQGHGRQHIAQTRLRWPVFYSWLKVLCRSLSRLHPVISCLISILSYPVNAWNGQKYNNKKMCINWH